MAITMDKLKTVGEDLYVGPRIPQGLTAAIEGLTKEIIRHRPEDIYIFAANHFEKLLEIRKQYDIVDQAQDDKLRLIKEFEKSSRKHLCDCKKKARSSPDVSNLRTSGWSLNETAKVLKRHRSIFGDVGKKISLDEIYALANVQSPKKLNGRNKDHIHKAKAYSKSDKVNKTEEHYQRKIDSSREKRSNGDKMKNGNNQRKKISNCNEIKSDRQKSSKNDSAQSFESSTKISSNVHEINYSSQMSKMSIEEIQSHSYVQKVYQTINETTSIMEEKVEELKQFSGRISKSGVENSVEYAEKSTITPRKISSCKFSRSTTCLNDFDGGKSKTDVFETKLRETQHLLEKISTNFSDTMRRSISAKDLRRVCHFGDLLDSKMTDPSSSSKFRQISLPTVRPLSANKNELFRKFSLNGNESLTLPVIFQKPSRSAKQSENDITLPILSPSSNASLSYSKSDDDKNHMPDKNFSVVRDIDRQMINITDRKSDTLKSISSIDSKTEHSFEDIKSISGVDIEKVIVTDKTAEDTKAACDPDIKQIANISEVKSESAKSTPRIKSKESPKLSETQAHDKKITSDVKFKKADSVTDKKTDSARSISDVSIEGSPKVSKSQVSDQKLKSDTKVKKADSISEKKLDSARSISDVSIEGSPKVAKSQIDDKKIKSDVKVKKADSISEKKLDSAKSASDVSIEVSPKLSGTKAIDKKSTADVKVKKNESAKSISDTKVKETEKVLQKKVENKKSTDLKIKKTDSIGDKKTESVKSTTDIKVKQQEKISETKTSDKKSASDIKAKKSESITEKKIESPKSSKDTKIKSTEKIISEKKTEITKNELDTKAKQTTKISDKKSESPKSIADSKTKQTEKLSVTKAKQTESLSDQEIKQKENISEKKIDSKKITSKVSETKTDDKKLTSDVKIKKADSISEKKMESPKSAKDITKQTDKVVEKKAEEIKSDQKKPDSAKSVTDTKSKESPKIPETKLDEKKTTADVKVKSPDTLGKKIDSAKSTPDTKAIESPKVPATRIDDKSSTSDTKIKKVDSISEKKTESARSIPDVKTKDTEKATEKKSDDKKTTPELKVKKTDSVSEKKVECTKSVSDTITKRSEKEPETKLDEKKTTCDIKVKKTDSISEKKVECTKSTPDTKIKQIEKVPETKPDDKKSTPDIKVKKTDSISEKKVECTKSTSDSTIKQTEKVSENKTEDKKCKLESKVEVKEIVCTLDKKSDDSIKSKVEKTEVSGKCEKKVEDTKSMVKTSNDISRASSIDETKETKKEFRRQNTEELFENGEMQKSQCPNICNQGINNELLRSKLEELVRAEESILQKGRNQNEKKSSDFQLKVADGIEGIKADFAKSSGKDTPRDKQTEKSSRFTEEISSSRKEKLSQEQNLSASSDKNQSLSSERLKTPQSASSVYSYILTEGSPCDIPDTVTTVIIPEKYSSPTHSDEFKSARDRDIEIKIEEINESYLNNFFGETIRYDETQFSSMQDVDMMRGMKNIHDTSIMRQDLHRIKEEEEEEEVEDISVNEDSTIVLEKILENEEIEICQETKDEKESDISLQEFLLHCTLNEESTEDVSMNDAAEALPYVPELNLKVIEDATESTSKTSGDKTSNQKSPGGRSIDEIENSVLHTERTSTSARELQGITHGNASGSGKSTARDESNRLSNRNLVGTAITTSPSSNEKLIRAVVTIQKCYRRYKSKKLERIGSCSRTTSARGTEGSIITQAKTENYIECKESIVTESTTSINDLVRAAVTIQKYYRNYKSRKLQTGTTIQQENISPSKKIDKEIVKKSKATPSLEEMARAAIKIQKFYKKYKSQKNVKLKQKKISSPRTPTFTQHYLQHTGEFHDCIPLSVLDSVPKFVKPEQKTEKLFQQGDSSDHKKRREWNRNPPLSPNLLHSAAFVEELRLKENNDEETAASSGTPRSGRFPGVMIYADTLKKTSKMPSPRRMDKEHQKFMNFVLFSGEETMLQNPYVNFVTQSVVSDGEKIIRNETVQEHLEFIDNRESGVIIEEITNDVIKK